jgi:hypothetical protein
VIVHTILLRDPRTSVIDPRRRSSDPPLIRHFTRFVFFEGCVAPA